jgi:hypothetical protein
MSKTPFIDGYLDKFEEDDETKDILSKNKCNVIHYADATKDEKQNLLEYDYVVILSYEQFNDFEIQDKFMFDKLILHKKLMFVDEYVNEKINPLIYNIKHGFKITINENIKKVYLSNNMMFISVVSKMHIIRKPNLLNLLNITNMLPSSIKIINIGHSFLVHKKINNLPNNVIILNICGNLTANDGIKLPKNIIFIVSAMNLALVKKHISCKYFANAFKIKTKKTKIFIGEYHSKKSTYSYSVIKNSNMFEFDFLCTDFTNYREKINNGDTIFTIHQKAFKKNTNFFKYCLLTYNNKNHMRSNILDNNMITGEYESDVYCDQIIYNQQTKISSIKNKEIFKFLVDIDNTIEKHGFLNERNEQVQSHENI